MILVELLKPFYDGDENAEASNYPLSLWKL